MVEYVIVDMSGKRKPVKAIPLALYAMEEGYDIETYTDMALKAAETLLLPFGYDVPRLRETMGCAVAGKKTRAAPAGNGQGSLFES